MKRADGQAPELTTIDDASPATPRRLRDLLLAWLLLPSLLLWGLSFAIGYQRNMRLANEAYDRTLLGSALVIADSLIVVEGLVVADLRASALEMLRTESRDRIYYRIIDIDDGRFVTGYEDLPSPPREPGLTPVFYDQRYKDQAVRIVAIRYGLLDEVRRRQFQVEVAETMEARRALTRQLAIEAAVPTLLLLAGASMFIVVGVQRGLAPLTRLGQAVRRRAAADIGPIPQERVVREVAPLIEAINLHAARHRQLSEAQVRFVSNASHQLKTPLTALRARIDLALQQPDPSIVRGVLLQIRESERWMQRMIDQLLSLARSEPGHALDFERIDLAELARDTTFELVVIARGKGIDLGFEGEWPVIVDGEPALLRELVANLVHNAISYTPDGGHVTVRVTGVDGRPRLEVIDDGPGIAPADRPRVFERFHRLSGTSAGTGSGLGLAIVKEICDRHGLTTGLEDGAVRPRGPVGSMAAGQGPQPESGPPRCGLRVVIDWPIAPMDTMDTTAATAAPPRA